MVQSITTIEKILDTLNHGDKDKPWICLPGIHSIREVRVNNVGKLEDTNIGTVLKNFLNQKTGEVKSYVARLTDDPEASKLL